MQGLRKALSVCKGLKPEGSLLFGSTVQKTITERAETMLALSKTVSKTDYGGDSKSFFELAWPVGTAGVWTRPLKGIFLPLNPQTRHFSQAISNRLNSI